MKCCSENSTIRLEFKFLFKKKGADEVTEAGIKQSLDHRVIKATEYLTTWRCRNTPLGVCFGNKKGIKNNFNSAVFVENKKKGRTGLVTQGFA